MAAALAQPPARIQTTWPTRPVRIVAGFTGGSSPDLVARTLAEPLAQAWGQPVIVENRPGASGNIATDYIARATDGYTLGIVINGNLTSARMLYPKLPYDPAKDFAYLSLLVTAPLALVTQTERPAGAAFLAAARQAGAVWNYGSVGVGSIGHLGMELLKSKAPGIAAVHIPFQGNPQVVTALLAGQIQMALLPPAIAAPQLKAGKLQAIGLTSPGRSALLPGVPPLADAGVRDFDLQVWNALLGPARLPAAARQRIGAVLAPLLQAPQVRQRLFDQGWQAFGSSPEGMAERVRQETAALQRIITAQGIHLE
ncbi:MAG: tripartite tricarboxylate transporter substrate binding protein [Burkholderiaceae bacterium]|jgi:tripartite-type tricarboxylate transporter receptor subunit TctC|nr:tripartite tricarboxylate transporter substrate binding protein [Burkholderiaceae bacterium]